ncbi:USP6 N-terminal-like protein [Liparis tanakae]|uniref:USP6 N-terminal-like protein n=1 Tax=Liparis tanakae TaxID=230148 RepID=A0A4Z2HZR5_9TELE|nr:USP6 N-terminal-like protein [Liparis tanakae]
MALLSKEEEFPKKPLGQLPPELAVGNHTANGQSHVEPAEPPRNPSPEPERQRGSRPPSRSRRNSLEKSMRHHKAEKREMRSRGSGEIPDEQRKPSTTPPSAATPTPQVTGDRGRHHGHAAANQNSNAASSSRREITPRWFKPSDTKLEAVKAAAREVSGGASPAPSSPEDSAAPRRRPASKGSSPNANRGSNASQYDNVPGLQAPEFEILELDKPPSRMRTPRSETPGGGPALHQGNASLAGSAASIASGPRGAKHPLPPAFAHHSPGGVHAGYPGSQSQYSTPPQQLSPGRTPTEVPASQPAHPGLDPRGEERLLVPSSRFPPSSGVAFGERAYATAQRPNRDSPEKTLVNNSYASYRRPPPASSNRSARPPPVHLETHGGSTPIYLQQLNSGTQVYEFEGRQRGEAVPHYLPEGVGPRRPADVGLPWASEDGVPRSPSFQQAQMTPVQEFSFPPNADGGGGGGGALHYRTQFQKQQPPQLFGGPHYRQEAFAMQESMLL